MLYKNGRDRDLINEAITAAASLGPQKIGYIGDRSLLTTIYDDVGYVDFVKMAFHIFGLRIESLYYMFFLILSVSTLIFILSFPYHRGAQLVLLCTLATFLVEMHTDVFIGEAPTITGMRHSSMLGLIPMWQFAFLILQRRRPSWATVPGTLVQLFILVLACRIRGSAIWMDIFIGAVAVAVAFLEWRRLAYPERSYKQLALATCCWPLLTLAGGVAANHLYSDEALHPVYFTDDVIPYHGLWHSSVVGFMYTPELFSSPYRPEEADKYGWDMVGYFEAMNYLARTHFLPPMTDVDHFPIGYISPWTNTIKFRFHDNIMRRVFFQAVERHPITALRLYLHKKPWAIYMTINSLLQGNANDHWLIILVTSAIILGLLFSFFSLEREEITRLLLLWLGGLFISTLPNMWAYAAIQTVTDLFIMLLGLMVLAGAVAICWGAASGRLFLSRAKA